MPRKKSVEIRLNPPDQTQLDRQRKRARPRQAVRAEIVLRAARGDTNYMIAKVLGVSRNTVKKWRYRFAREGVTGLKSRPIPGRPPRELQDSSRTLVAPAGLVLVEDLAR